VLRSSSDSRAPRSRRGAQATWLLSLLAGLVSLDCSALYSLNASQCTSDADCSRFTGTLTAPVCRERVCVSTALADGGAGGDSRAGAGGGGNGGSAGAETAGAGGAPPECTTNSDCIDANFGNPFICQGGSCLSLITKECPLVLGADNLRSAETIVYGAYALAPDAVSKSIATRNIDLAITQLTTKVTGLHGGANGVRRTLSVVVCNSAPDPSAAPGNIDAFLPSLNHLVDAIHVPGIIAALKPADLAAIYEQKLAQSNTFVVNPYEKDSELSDAAQAGSLWSMLGATTDLAPPYGPLLQRTEAYLRRDTSFLNLSKSNGKLRVAIVAATDRSDQDVSDAVLALPELSAYSIKPISIDSAELVAAPDVSTPTQALFDFAPNIIVALAGSEFVEKVFPLLENGGTWSTNTAGQQRPFYVLGSQMAPETWQLYAGNQGTPGGWKSFFNRMVGVAYASALDPRLLDAYRYQLTAANTDLSDTSVLLGSENVYDAAYLMIYATAAAGNQLAPTGADLSRGVLSVVQGTPFDIGPSTIPAVLNAFDQGSMVALTLTEGPANWDIAHGTRTGIGSVYCFNDGQDPGESSASRGPTLDAIRYDSSTHTLASNALLCIPNF